MIARSTAPLALLLMASACNQSPSVNSQDAIENAVNDDLNVVDANDDRADHLDEKAAELLDQANATTGSAAAALRNEATGDLAAAAAIRQQGQSSGDQIEDTVEANAGLLNNR